MFGFLGLPWYGLDHRAGAFCLAFVYVDII
nr:MAG TPA: hypothetical protein [Caudoviricetes sp.]